MCEYKNLPVWKMAYTVGQRVHLLAANATPCTALIASLREHAQAMPVCIAIGSLNAKPGELAEALHTCFTHAHDTEMLLFVAIATGRLCRKQSTALMHQVHALKRVLVAQYLHSTG